MYHLTERVRREEFPGTAVLQIARKANWLALVTSTAAEGRRARSPQHVAARDEQKQNDSFLGRKSFHAFFSRPSYG